MQNYTEDASISLKEEAFLDQAAEIFGLQYARIHTGSVFDITVFPRYDDCGVCITTHEYNYKTQKWELYNAQ